MISELKRAFEIGFLLFLPFLIIDLVVASVLMSMGMMMLPPVVVSLENADHEHASADAHSHHRLERVGRWQVLDQPVRSAAYQSCRGVTQVLSNGNLVVEGKQEMRVNFEVRELIVAGIVRPEDIESDTTIDSSKIAQARTAYGGRSQFTDIQQDLYGQQ
jgi:Flagellar L-ring protein/FliP family